MDRIEAKGQPKGLSPKTVRNIHQVISSAMDFARSQTLIAVNPTDGCTLPKLEHREMKTLLVELLTSFPREAKDSGVFEMYYIELATGLWRQRDVFPSPTGGPILPDSVIQMLHRVLKRLDLPKVRFHDLRHTFATVALQSGVDIKAVSGMLGHYSAGFTLDTYAHVTTAAQREATKTMGNILSSAI